MSEQQTHSEKDDNEKLEDLYKRLNNYLCQDDKVHCKKDKKFEIKILQANSVPDYIDIVSIITKIWRYKRKTEYDDSQKENQENKDILFTPGEVVPWFRGVSHACYELEPSMLRSSEPVGITNIIKKDEKENDNEDDSKNKPFGNDKQLDVFKLDDRQLVKRYLKAAGVIEYYTLRRFYTASKKHTNIDLFSGEPKMSIQLMILMQHHGLSTRLLDWSKSALIALYFSLRKMNTENVIKQNNDELFCIGSGRPIDKKKKKICPHCDSEIVCKKCGKKIEKTVEDSDRKCSSAVWVLNPRMLRRKTQQDEWGKILIDQDEDVQKVVDLEWVKDNLNKIEKKEQYEEEIKKSEEPEKVKKPEEPAEGIEKYVQYPLPVIPSYLHDRISVQQSRFTLHSPIYNSIKLFAYEDYDEQKRKGIEEDLIPRVLYKIVIPHANRLEMLTTLRLLGWLPDKSQNYL